MHVAAAVVVVVVVVIVVVVMRKINGNVSVTVRCHIYGRTVSRTSSQNLYSFICNTDLF